jgi:stage II sporulation protein D
MTSTFGPRSTPVQDRQRRAVIAPILAAAATVAALWLWIAIATPVAAADPAPSPAPSASAEPSPTPAPTASPSPAPAVPAWPTTTTTLDDTVQFFGRGYGHGVGLNQYGARGRALAGESADEILAAYFAGTTTGTTSPTRNVRVRLMAGYKPTSSSPLRIYGHGGDWEVKGIAGTYPADAQARIWLVTKVVNGVTTTSWRLRVDAPDGTRLLRATVTKKVVIRPASDTTVLQLFSKPSVYDTYRGRLKVFLRASTIKVVNHVGLDDYLRGVVPVEMPSSWPAAALQAQTVSARSYTVRRLHPGRGSFDLYDDSRSQVYRGVKAERSTTDAAIAGTAGEILMSGTSVVNAFYHSTGGGATEDNEYAWVSSTGKVVAGAVGYLRGVEDVASDGTPYDAAAPHYAWTTTPISREMLSAIMSSDPRTDVGDLQRLNLTHRGVSGRLYRIKLVGSEGKKLVSGDVFRSVYNRYRPAGTRALLSNLFNLSPLPGP